MHRRPRHPVAAWIITVLAAAVLVVFTFRAWMVWAVVLLGWLVGLLIERRRDRRGGYVVKE